jgi:hypothetical protein
MQLVSAGKDTRRHILQPYILFRSLVGDKDGMVRGSNLGGGARFSAPVQTSSVAHPASYTEDTVLFPGVKRWRRDVDYTPLISNGKDKTIQLQVWTGP